MNPDPLNLPPARTWRDISQPVRPRTMSRGGRWRLALSVLRSVGFGAVLGGLVLGGWSVAAAIRGDSRAMPASAKAVPLRAPELVTDRDGVLDAAWLARTLALPKGVSLLELDLARLRERVLADLQVRTATLTRHFPDRLVVKITERSPIARARVALKGGEQRDVLVARDGAAFFGAGFDPAGLATLPWLSGVSFAPDALGFRAGGDIEPLARLLADAQFSAPHLYRQWHSVSLARLAADRALEVTMKNGTLVMFTAKEGYFLQLARLDYVAERLAKVPGIVAKVDLTLGREVPVMADPVTNTQVKVRGRRAGPDPLLSAFNLSQPPPKREL
ncbi:MAG: FtsQ-type POTRA domain-containing protein [Opitutaceae bacterium]|nr:FtsQ-type POTRA domain-containing protein [Opitutaceae bacterium]